MQSIPDNTKCRFSFNELFSECFAFFPEEISEEQAKSLEGTTCTVESLETYTELGQKDFEYYNIKFDLFPDTNFVGFSGYHLTVLGEKK